MENYTNKMLSKHEVIVLPCYFSFISPQTQRKPSAKKRHLISRISVCVCDPLSFEQEKHNKTIKRNWRFCYGTSRTFGTRGNERKHVARVNIWSTKRDNVFSTVVSFFTTILRQKGGHIVHTSFPNFQPTSVLGILWYTHRYIHYIVCSQNTVVSWERLINSKLCLFEVQLTWYFLWFYIVSTLLELSAVSFPVLQSLCYQYVLSYQLCYFLISSKCQSCK